MTVETLVERAVDEGAVNIDVMDDIRGSNI
jgi:hypothetical protein